VLLIKPFIAGNPDRGKNAADGTVRRADFILAVGKGQRHAEEDNRAKRDPNHFPMDHVKPRSNFRAIIREIEQTCQFKIRLALTRRWFTR
jgi:hypothetical protein